jgi:hypothetical protein
VRAVAYGPSVLAAVRMLLILLCNGSLVVLGATMCGWLKSLYPVMVHA